MTEKWTNYIHGGYDPRDGLDERAGRWMRDTWGVVVWVVTAREEKGSRDAA